MIAQALFTCLGGGIASPDPLMRLADYESLELACRWGLAMRLGQRLSGGVAGPLQRTRLAVEDSRLLLRTEPADAILYGEAVERRHRALAALCGLEARLG